MIGSPSIEQTISQTAADGFVSMLPSIQGVAAHAFRRVPCQRREELIAEVVANCYVAYVHLVKRGRKSVAYPTPLAQFAIKQVCGGREVGMRQNVRDVMSSYAQKRKCFSVFPLVRQNSEGEWEDVLVEGRRPILPTSRRSTLISPIGFWLLNLRRMHRQIALCLASGDTPSELAERLRVSRARVSQLRNELRNSWEQFQAVPAA